MVRHHVAQRADAVVKAPAPLDTHRLRGGDLHGFDVVPVPQGLEDAVGEAQCENVLHRLLAEVMVDPIDLPLLEHLQNSRVERLRAREVFAERFLDHHAAKRAVFLFHESVLAEPLDDVAEEARRGREVEHHVPRAEFFREIVQARAQALVGAVVVEVAAHVEEMWRERFSRGAGGLAALRTLEYFLAKVLVRAIAGREAQDRVMLRQQALRLEVGERGREQPFGEIATRTENDDHAIGGAGCPLVGARPGDGRDTVVVVPSVASRVHGRPLAWFSRCNASERRRFSPRLAWPLKCA